MTFTLALVVAAFFTSSFAADIPESQQKFYDVNTQLCGIGIKQWYEVDPKKNQVSSAFPLGLGYIQLARNSKEDHLNKILALLNQTSLDDAITVAQNVLPNLNANNEVYFAELPYSIFADKSNTFTEDFTSAFASIFNGTAQNVDFSDKDAVAAAIKEFLGLDSDNTDIVVDTSNTKNALILATRQKFKFNWAEEETSYRPYKEVEIAFTQYDGTTSTKSGYYCEGDGKYAKIDDLGIEVYQFALKGGLPILYYRPFDESSMKSILEKLTDAATLATILTKLEDKYLKISVSLPTTLRDVRDFVPEVQMANITTTMFEEDFDGFSTIIENASGYILKFFNSLTVNFDAPTEEQAASKTVDPETIIDGPFFYTLLDQYNTPALIGIVTN